MANVLNEEKKQQVLALGRLGWSLRRIQQATGIRRETAGAYLKAAGIAVRPPSGWGRCEPKPANEVITDSGAAKPAIPAIPDPLDPNVNPNPENLSTKGKAKATSKPANENEVITDSAVVSSPSACEPYREAIDLGLSRGRNAMAIWQDLVSQYDFASSYQSVQRFVSLCCRQHKPTYVAQRFMWRSPLGGPEDAPARADKHRITWRVAERESERVRTPDGPGSTSGGSR